jgi:hypothetical protein
MSNVRAGKSVHTNITNTQKKFSLCMNLVGQTGRDETRKEHKDVSLGIYFTVHIFRSLIWEYICGFGCVCERIRI